MRIASAGARASVKGGGALASPPLDPDHALSTSPQDLDHIL